MDGLVIADKHPGPTSSQFTSEVRRLLGASKAGHSGTLDPNASGVLPILLDKATRLARFLLLAPKEYVALVKFHKPIDEEILLEALKAFRGEIYQKPPVRSKVAKRLRVRRIYEAELIELEGREAIIRRLVESGTYIRKLVRDIGLYIGINAHMAELRRTRVAHLSEEEALNLLEIKCLAEHKELIVKPPDYAVKHLPKISAKYLAARAFSHGHPLRPPGIEEGEPRGEYVRVYYKNTFIGVGRVEEAIKPEVILKTLRSGIFLAPSLPLADLGDVVRSLLLRLLGS